MLNEIDFRNPGWKIEPKYSPKVLIGNWYEERMRTDRGFYDLNFNPRWSDATIQRRLAMVKSDSLPKEILPNRDDDAKTTRVSGNYGLKEELQKKWAAPFGISRGGLNTTYSVDYTEWPRKSFYYRMPVQQTNRSLTPQTNAPHVTGPGESTTRYSRHMIEM